MRETTRKAMARGFSAGLLAGLTGRVRRTAPPAMMTARQMQEKAWRMTGDAIRKAMDRQ